MAVKELFKTFSHSQRTLFAQCPRKYSYRYLHDQKEAQGTAASFSSQCVHPLIQAMHETQEQEAYFLSLAASNFDRWARQTDITEQLKEPHCSLATLQSIVRQYLPQVQADREEGWKCDGVEVTRVLPQHANDAALRYTAKVDVLESRYETKRIIECKFSASSVTKLWEIDNQLVGYAACFDVPEILLVGVQCEKGRKGEPWKVHVSREVVRIQEDIKDEWQAEMERQRTNLVMAWTQDVWAKETQACWSYGKLCTYSALCQAGEARRFMLASHDEKEVA